MKISFFLSTLLLSSAALAASGGHGHGEVPVNTIIYQTINVVILIAGLIYLLRTPVRNFFREKREQYMLAAAKTQAAREAAENEHKEIRQKLEILEANKEETISRAKAEAADLRNQLVAEAEQLSKRIQEEAKNAASNEVARARKQLREQLIADSIEAARKDLEGRVSSADHQRLQSDFISNIQAGQQ